MAKKNQSPVQQTAIGDGNLQIEGDYNTVNVNQTFIQKVINIFRDDAEVVDQRNRKIMLEHVENFWVKGFLEKSLYGAVLLELGIKESPDLLNYPWAIKRIPTKEILPAGMPMIEIFQEIGMRRSLLILGAPGSGKTIMLLELVRQLIERARLDVIETIPVVFNLSSWTEKLTLTDWLVRELTVFYTIPKRVATTWVKESKMLLLLDGLDEVRQESRNKCVEAINKFRKDNGLTRLAVCSRTEDYVELNTRLSFDGAIEIQPLTPNQVTDYFEQLGEEVKGIREVLEKDSALNDMTETPLFLNVMTLAYSNMKNTDIIVSENTDVQRKYLFDAYVNRMFERPERTKKVKFSKQEVLLWLSWLAQKMIQYNQLPFLIANMQPKWLNYKENVRYRFLVGIMGMLGGAFLACPIFGFWGGVFGIFGISETNYELLVNVGKGASSVSNMN